MVWCIIEIGDGVGDINGIVNVIIVEEVLVDGFWSKFVCVEGGVFWNFKCIIGGYGVI